MRGLPLAIGGESASVGRCYIVCGAQLRGRRSFAQHVEKAAIRCLRAMPERPAEVVQEDDRPALAERRGVTPEPQGMTEAGRRCRDRVPLVLR